MNDVMSLLLKGSIITVFLLFLHYNGVGLYLYNFYIYNLSSYLYNVIIYISCILSVEKLYSLETDIFM